MFKNEKINKIISIVLKTLSIVLFVLYFGQLYTKYALDEKQILPAGQNIFIIFLRAFTTAAVALSIFAPWFKGRNFKLVQIIYGLATSALNFAFYEQNMTAWHGKMLLSGEYEYAAINGFAYTPWRVAFFIAQNIIIILMAIFYLVEFLIRKDYKKLNLIRIILVAVLYPIIYTSPYFLEDLNLLLKITTSTESVKGFSGVHIAFLLSGFVIFFAMFFALRKKDYKTKQFAILSVSLAAFFNFFYYGLFGNNMAFHYGGLPFHLCNTAVILIFVAYAFHSERFFYFTFFVNVLGCLFAMLMPNYGDSTYWWHYGTFRFWFNHVFAFILPLLGMALGMFERPKIKSMLKAIGVFACYFILAMTLNAWFSNYDPGVNYFFLNDNFFFEKLNIGSGLKDNYVWEFSIKDLTFKFFPLFQAVVFIVYVGLMFVTWYIYDFLFHVCDSHKLIHEKKKIRAQQIIDFKKELNGRPLQDPLYLEDKGMIEIKHFTKVYSGSNKPSVEDLNLTIKDGEVYGFLGHNGAGKSTTIKSLVGIQSITSGQMIVDGYDVQKQPVEAKLRIGYVSDNHAVYERLTGREYVNYIADLYKVPQKERDERIDKYTKMFHLEDAIDREIKSYSHGMKQKIVVISSLIHDPKVWILDEPLTGLDPTSAFQIKECMREHAARGNIVFFSSHVIEVVEKICSRICIIGHGKLQCEYSLEELKEKGISLEELYLKYVSSEERIH